MIDSNLRCLIEAEVVRAYRSSPKRTIASDLPWLKRQCFKEFLRGTQFSFALAEARIQAIYRSDIDPFAFNY